jgi:methylisocitrate lyase
MQYRQQSWKRLLKQHAPLQLPAACDALTAKLIEQAGFAAYQVGGFALDGARFGFPDIDITRLGEKSNAVLDIVHACRLPVLVDCDEGYGDEKNVAHTVHVYDDIGASAIFIEDQKAPKKCGHMAKKEVIPAKDMVKKIRAAKSARRDPDKLFIIARTDALAVEGLQAALQRAEAYLKAGADGVYVEGPRNRRELRAVGREFKGEALAVSVLEGGGQTPWVPPDELHEMGFNMILYPTTLLFQQTWTIMRALEDLKAGKPMPQEQAVSMNEFETIVDIAYWKAVEQKVVPTSERIRQAVNKIFKKVA